MTANNEGWLYPEVNVKDIVDARELFAVDLLTDGHLAAGLVHSQKSVGSHPCWCQNNKWGRINDLEMCTDSAISFETHFQ